MTNIRTLLESLDTIDLEEGPVSPKRAKQEELKTIKYLRKEIIMQLKEIANLVQELGNDSELSSLEHHSMLASTTLSELESISGELRQDINSWDDYH
jgi:hypothetical protein